MFLDNTESTIMSILHGVAQGDKPGRNAYLERFCETYSEPLVEFLAATRRLPKEDSRDLVHDFWIKKLLGVPAEDNLISKYLRSRQGRETSSFRRYLARSLTLHFNSHWSSAAARKHRDFVPLEQALVAEPASETDLDAFDDIWVSHLFQKVIDGVREECLRDGGTADRWTIFVEIKLKPCLLGVAPKSYSELAEMLDMADPKSVGNSWITVKRMFERHFHQAVQDYVPTASIAESAQAAGLEVQELLRQLAGMRALHISIPEVANAANDSSMVSAFDMTDPKSDMVYRNERDLENAWRVLLDTPLKDWLVEDGGTETITLNTILEHPKPSLELLDSVRVHAKRLGKNHASVSESNDFVPTEFFAVTYLLAVVLASTRLNTNISKSKPADTAKKIDSMRRLRWIDSTTKSVFDNFLETH